MNNPSTTRSHQLGLEPLSTVRGRLRSECHGVASSHSSKWSGFHIQSIVCTVNCCAVFCALHVCGLFPRFAAPAGICSRLTVDLAQSPCCRLRHLWNTKKNYLAPSRAHTDEGNQVRSLSEIMPCIVITVLHTVLQH